MIMRAKQDGNLVVFELEGHLDFDTTVAFQESCQTVMKKSEGSRVVFDLSRLRFVGSSGINQFIQTMKEFNSIHPRPRIMKASSEFTKIFKALQAARRPFEFVDSIEKAIEGFNTEPALSKITKKKKMARA